MLQVFNYHKKKYDIAFNKVTIRYNSDQLKKITCTIEKKTIEAKHKNLFR